jgi:hypothetical protein
MELKSCNASDDPARHHASAGQLAAAVDRHRNRMTHHFQILGSSRAEATLARERAIATATSFEAHAEASRVTLYRRLSASWPGNLLVALARTEEATIAAALESLRDGDSLSATWLDVYTAARVTVARYVQHLDAMLATIARGLAPDELAALADTYRQAVEDAQHGPRMRGSPPAYGHLPPKSAR